ncbi:MAG: PAS domain S-box protein [Promethearchaeota archaeon]
MDLSTDKFIQIIESIKECYFEVDLKGTFTFFNESLCKLTGYSREELLGLNYKYIADEENRKKVFKGFNTVYTTGLPLTDLQYEFRNKNGAKIIGETSVYLKFDSKGNKTGFYGLFRDITKKIEEEKKFKKELKQLLNLRTQELRESEEKYRNLLENLDVGFYSTTLDGRMLNHNRAHNIILGYDPSENLKNKDVRAFWQYPEQREDYIKLILKNGIAKNYICYALTKDGKKIVVELNSYLIRNESGDPIRIDGTFFDVTEKFNLERKLKISEEKYRNLVENAQEGVWAVDENDDTIFVNPKICEMLGYTRDEIMGENLHLFLEDPMIELINSYRKRREKGLKDTYELEFIKKDRTILSTSINAAPILNEDGDFKGSFAFINDITNRKIAEQNLKKSEEKYRALFENSPNMIVLLNLEGEIIDLNPEILNFYGYEKDDFLHKNFRTLNTFPMEDLPRVVEVYKKLINKEDVEPIELQFYNKDGSITWVNSLANLVEIENEAYIQVIVQDINERKIAELKLKESEERYRNLIETVPFSIALIDRQGKIVYTNPTIEKLLGYSQDELIGHEFKNIPAINPNYIPITLKRFQKVLKGEILPPLEIELHKKDGSLIWIKYQTSLVKLGNDVLMQAVINDITEQKKADLLIEEEILKLKELDQIRKDLISRVSHELKTPLVSICGAAELLLDLFIEEFKDEPKELIEMIEKGGRRLKYLVDNLVDITRIEYKKFELEKYPNDINQLIRDCVREMMYLINKRKLNLKLELHDGLFLEIDKIRIEQVVLNLLSNAIKNTPPNGKITVKSLKKNNYVEISISDTGIGLTKEEMDKLFTRFGKIERYGNGLEFIDIQGTGLGLYISKEIIDLHEGQIWVESEGRDKGSIFTIKIPI